MTTLEHAHQPANITPKDIRDLVEQYQDVASEKAAEFDSERYIVIPQTVDLRKTDGEAFIVKAELIQLMEWKLSHGKFRPNLRKLISQNDEDTVVETTKAGFAETEVDKAIPILTKLRGVGPATASLLLSVHDPDNVPFFSDELFRWISWEETGTGKGWDRTIKYSIPEYRHLRASVEELKTRLDEGNEAAVSVVDIEKAAYVLGQTSKPDTTAGQKRKRDRD